jgi:outer membrane lipoprotein-sorting protein
MVVKSYSEGDKNSFSEYLAPPRDAGTKMLKLEDKLWIYEPSSDRTIQLSGNMLRQSVMGSDLSYEDFMEETKLQDMYNATVTGEDTLSGKICWIVDLKAVNEDVAYSRRILWVDKESFLPMKEERYAKSGKLLKTAVINEVMKVEGRFYPKSMTFKDELKKGEGTELVIDEISFDAKIPEFYFTKGALKK